jgi:hypothetical protein
MQADFFEKFVAESAIFLLTGVPTFAIFRAILKPLQHFF